MDENKKNRVLKILGLMLIVFISTFLAFYFAIITAFNNLFNPEYHIKHFDKMFKRQEREFQKLEKDFDKHIFSIQKRNHFVKTDEDNNSYKIIIDLKPLDGDEKAVNVKVKDNNILVDWNINKKDKKGEFSSRFAEVYYLDKKLQADKMTKQKNGNDYIITIPFEK